MDGEVALQAACPLQRDAQLGDASAAIVGRIILLMLSRSWLGKEDSPRAAHSAGAARHPELGARRAAAPDRQQRHRFTRLPSAEEAIITMRDLASPVGAFVRERCTSRANLQVGVDELYAAFKVWCEDGEYPKSSKAVFGRNLMAACSNIRKARVGGGRAAPTFIRVSLWRKTVTNRNWICDRESTIRIRNCLDT